MGNAARAPAAAPRRLVWMLAVAAIVCWVNRSVLRYDWLMFDDDVNILFNPFLGRGALSTVAWAFQNLDYMRRYLPLGWLGFDALLAIDGYNATVFHAASWVLGGLNAALAFLLFEQICARAAVRDSVFAGVRPLRRLVAAALASLAWSLHPLRVGTAGWISGLLYLGATTMALLALLLRLHADGAASPQQKTRRNVAAALAYLSSVLVYPVFLALPALLAWGAAAMSPRGTALRAARHEIARLASWWLAGLFVAGMNIFAVATSSDAWRRAHPTLPYTWTDWLTGIARALAHYLAQIVWPHDVAVVYPSRAPILGGTIRGAVLGAAAIIALGLLFRYRSRRAILGCAVAIVLSLSPFLAQMGSSFNPADRYAVLALLVCGGCVCLMLLRLRTRRAFAAGFASAGAVVIAFSCGYSRALPNWRDTAAVQASIDRSTAAFPNVGLRYARAATVAWFLGHRDQAAARLHEGELLFPQNPELRATRQFLASLESAWRARVGAATDIPPVAVQHVDLGRAWLARGETAAAAAHFQRAFALAPNYLDAVRGWQQTQDSRSESADRPHG